MDKEKQVLKQKIEDAINKNRETYESTILTLLTAGLLVALSLNPESFRSISLFGKSAYKLTLFLVALTAMSMLCSFVCNEIALKRMKKFVNDPANTHVEWEKKRKLINTIAKSIDYFNNIVTILCIGCFVVFAYMVVRMKT